MRRREAPSDFPQRAHSQKSSYPRALAAAAAAAAAADAKSQTQSSGWAEINELSLSLFARLC